MRPHLELIARESAGDEGHPPLLFVHGICGGAWCWEEHFLDYFAANGFDSYALSLRGHGGSGRLECLRWTSIAEYVDDVALASAGLSRPPVVIGHSFGTLVVRKYLETHCPPAAALLAPTPVAGMVRISARLALRHPWLGLLVCLTLEPGHFFSTPGRARDFLFSPTLNQDTVRRYAARLGRESFRAFAGMVFNHPAPTPSRAVPMLVLGAEMDRLTPPSGVPQLAGAYRAEWQIIPGIAHALMLDTAWKDAAGALLEWLHRVLEPGPEPGGGG